MTAIRQAWAGGEHDFLLRIGELRILNERCRGGPFAAMQRVIAQVPEVDDIYEPVRLGLIGAGMDKDEARKLVEKVEDQKGLGAMMVLSQQILFRAFHREEADDDEGKPEAPEQTAES